MVDQNPLLSLRRVSTKDRRLSCKNLHGHDPDGSYDHQIVTNINFWLIVLMEWTGQDSCELHFIVWEACLSISDYECRTGTRCMTVGWCDINKSRAI